MSSFREASHHGPLLRQVLPTPRCFSVIVCLLSPLAHLRGWCFLPVFFHMLFFFSPALIFNSSFFFSPSSIFFCSRRDPAVAPQRQPLTPVFLSSVLHYFPFSLKARRGTKTEAAKTQPSSGMWLPFGSLSFIYLLTKDEIVKQSRGIFPPLIHSSAAISIAPKLP